MTFANMLDVTPSVTTQLTARETVKFIIFTDFKIGLIRGVLKSLSDNLLVPWGNFDNMCYIIYQ